MGLSDNTQFKIRISADEMEADFRLWGSSIQIP